jgi:hypothetical protein
MPYACAYEVPGGEEMYRRVKSEIGPTPPDGLVVQLVVKNRRGLRHIQVWDSKDQWEQFRDGKVRPAVNRILATMGIPEPPTPVEETMQVVDVWA